MITVSFYAIFIVLYFRLIGSFLGVKCSKKIFFISATILTISLMIIGFHTVPHKADDLYRYYAEIEIFKSTGFKYAMAFGTWKDTILSNMFLYFCAIIDKKEIIPLIGAGIIPAISYLIMNNYFENKISYRILFFIELLVTGFCEIYICLSVFRYSYGAALAALLIILDAKGIIKNTPLKVALYMSLPLIHSSLISVSLIALMTTCIKKKALAIEFSVLFTFNIIKNYLSNSSIPILSSIAFKMTQYNVEYSIGTSFFLSTTIIIGVITLYIICYKVMKKKKKNKESTEKLTYIFDFITNFLFFLILMLPTIPALFYRLYYIIILISIPFVMEYMKSKDGISKYIILFVLCNCIFIKFIFQYNNYFSHWILR